MSLAAWKSAKPSDQTSSAVAIRQTFEIAKDADGLSIVMSSANQDRQGDTINQTGWRLDSFKSNPVLLWGHDSFSPPVGRVKATALEDGKLKAKGIEWVPREVSEFAWSVSQLVELGFVKSVSVGFRPLKWTYREDGGVDFTEQELLELSFVTLPANVDAMVEGKGFDLAPVDMWAAAIVQSDRAGLAVDEAKAWLAARAPALEAKANEADEEEAKGEELPEVVDLTAAVKELTAVMRERLELEKTLLVSMQKQARAPRTLPSGDLVSAVRAKLHGD